VTPHEPKSTAYHDPGHLGGPHPFGGAEGASPAAAATDALGGTGAAGLPPSYGGPLTGSKGTDDPLAGVSGSAGTAAAGSRGRHAYLEEAAAYLSETAAAVPQAQPASAQPISRRSQRALYKHATLGPLRAEDPSASGEDFFDLLARLAEPEEWGGAPSGPAQVARSDDTWVLREYIEQTFERLYRQRRILTSPDGAHSVFNTGLVTSRQEEIYGLFVPSRDPDGAPWRLQGWYTESERELQTHFPELPPAATYAEEPAELVYDWRCELVVNAGRLLESAENLAALPAPLNANPYQAGLVLEGAVRRAQSRARRDYRAAVPCWDPLSERVRLLLPLSLTSPDAVDAALMVGREDAQEVYRGHRLLALDIAYARARQLARPHDWLTPPAASS